MRAARILTALAVAVWLMPLGRSAAAPRVPERVPCRVFPANNVWNMDVSRLPVHPRSRVWKQATHAGSTLLHPDFGPPAYGLPYDVVAHSKPRVRVRFRYASESDRVGYPFGPGVPIEGGSDRHAIMIDHATCTLFELYDARWNGGRPSAGSGAVFRLAGPRANDLRPVSWTSADAAGLPIFPGLLRFDEVKAGAVRHALRFTVGCTSRKFLWPARHQAGVADARCPPMGARFRLNAGFSPAGFGPGARVVLRAMKRFGVIVADNGSDWYFQGTVDPRWTNGLMDQLKRIPASAFVAVDESRCRVSGSSAAFAYGPGCPGPR
jgi:hypothetical protein